MRILFAITCVLVLIVIWWPHAEPIEPKVQTLRESYQDVARLNISTSAKSGCPDFNKLSLRKQIERVNEALGTPNEPGIGLK